jgi:tetratricopeptide (TPR) repeat protein
LSHNRCSEKDSRPLFSAGVCGVGLAFPLSAVGLELMGHGLDERLWWLGGIWWGLWLISVLVTQRTSAERSSEFSNSDAVAVRWSLEAANVALLVHLLGAGGIAMPAITQLLWLVWALRVGYSELAATERDEKSPSEPANGGVRAGRLPVQAFALVAGGLSVLCGWSGTMPELLCRTSLQLGDAEWGRGQNMAVRQRYLDASRADPYAIEPLDRLAEAAFQHWQATHAEHDFEESVKRMQAVITRLPFASRPYRRLGQIWMARFDHSRDAQDAVRAVAAYTDAIERYPHHAALLSELALAGEQAGLNEQTQEAARRAVQQDDLNRSAGHSDKYLNDQTRRRMQRLAAEPSEPN